MKNKLKNNDCGCGGAQHKETVNESSIFKKIKRSLQLPFLKFPRMPQYTFNKINQIVDNIPKAKLRSIEKVKDIYYAFRVTVGGRDEYYIYNTKTGEHFTFDEAMDKGFSFRGYVPTVSDNVNEFQRDRQLRNPDKEMLVVKNGKVQVIDKKDWKKYKRKGYIVAEKVIQQAIKNSVNEARRKVKLGVIHKAAKKGSFPVSLVVVKNSKVIDQDLVNTPEAVPAAFKVIQRKHKGAIIHIEDSTGRRLLSFDGKYLHTFESVNEAVKKGKKYGDWTVTQYEPVKYDDYGAPNGGRIKIVNQQTGNDLLIQNDLALRGSKWYISINRRSIKDTNPETVIQKAIKSSVNEAKVELEFDLFKNYNQRRPDKTMLVKVDDSVRLSKYLASPEFNRIKKQYDYVEVHYGDKFLGSMKAGTDNWEFKKGSDLSGSGFKESVVNEATSWNEDEKSAWEYVLSKGKKVAAKSKSKALQQYKNLFNQKLVTWDGFNDSVMLTKNGEDYLKKHGKSLGESVNETNGEFVVYVEKDNGRKKLLHTKKSQRAANMFMSKNMDKILNKSGIRSIGSMSKDQWEKKEAQYAENIKKSDMKTVTKKEWDRTHKDYKGMIKGQPYMMWFDKKTQSTVYGPVHIKESVNEAKALDFIVTSIPSSKIQAKYLPKADVGMGLSMYDKLGKGYVLTNRDYTLDYRKGKVALVLSRSGKQRVKARMSKDSTYLQKLQKFANDYLSKYVKDIKESVNEGISVFDERHFGKKGIIIMIDDNGKKVSAIFKDKKNADKYNRNKESDLKALLQLAKKTPYPKAIDEGKGDFGGWVAIYKGKRLEIDKSEANGIYGAKQIAIKKLKVPKSKQSLLAIAPAVEESVNESSLPIVDKKYGIAKVDDGKGNTWYVKKIDSTHMFMANDPKYLKKDRPTGVMAHHIGQHRDEPYYSELRSWLKESVNEASTRRSEDFFDEYKHGKEIRKMLKGTWNTSKVKKYLDTVGGSDIKWARIMDDMANRLGLDHRRYNNRPMNDMVNDILDKMEKLYSIHMSESVNESDVNEMKYSNQTGIKSSLLKNNEFNSLLNSKEMRWIKGNDVKIYKDRFGFTFTDGKREMVFNLKKPYSVVKPLGNARSEIKKVYQQNESVNESTEPQIITQLRDVMENGYQKLKDPKTGRKVMVDSFSASAMVKVYDGLKNPSVREKYVNTGIFGMQKLAFKFVK